MPQTRLMNRSGAPVATAAIDAFTAGLAGRAVAPGDAGYDAARGVWNAMIDRSPGLVVRCDGVADVTRAVDFAREQDILVAVRGGGHNVGGRGTCDDGLVIDLGGMTAVTVDPASRRVRVEGGATLADIDRVTHAHGLAVPTGTVSKTGIGGLALGGGVGWLVRRYGPTCDNVRAFEVVTAAGETVTASAEANPDLFWALRGGGGNFGVVTAFEFTAHPVSTVIGGLIVHARADAGAVLRHYRDFMVDAPADLTAYAALVTTQDGLAATLVIPCWCGDPAEGERVIAPLRTARAPLLDTVARLPFPEMQQALDVAFPDGTRNYWKSTFITELSDAAIDVIVDHANRATSPLTATIVEFYGAPSGAVGSGDGAFGRRRAEFDIGFMAQWKDPAEDAGHIAWSRAAYAAMAPYASGAYLLNFLGDEGDETIRAAFGEGYARLREVKRKYDPTNFFRLNQNIPVAA